MGDFARFPPTSLISCLAHIKSASLNLELQKISAVAERIEKNAKQNSLAGAPENVRAMIGELDSISQSLESDVS